MSTISRPVLKDKGKDTQTTKKTTLGRKDRFAHNFTDPNFETRWVNYKRISPGIGDRRGWEPVRISELKDAFISTDPEFQNSSKDGLVRDGDLILCKMPKDMNEELRNELNMLADEQINLALTDTRNPDGTFKNIESNLKSPKKLTV